MVAAVAALLAAAALAACGSPSEEGGVADSAAVAVARAPPAGAQADTVGLPPEGPPATCTDSGPVRGDTLDRGGEVEMEDTTGGRPPIHGVLARHRERWMERPGVVGTGIGRCDGEPCLVVYLRQRTECLEAALPDSVEGYAVRLEETGRVVPRDAEP